jgi:hypothetical protein
MDCGLLVVVEAALARFVVALASRRSAFAPPLRTAAVEAATAAGIEATATGGASSAATAGEVGPAITHRAAVAATSTGATIAATAATVATTTTATATAATPAESAAAAATTAATAATTAAILRLFHRDLTSLDVAAVDLLDRLARFVFGRHLDEAEAARTTRLTVRDDLRVRYGAKAAEEVAQVQLGDRVRQITNVESRSHLFLVAVM